MIIKESLNAYPQLLAFLEARNPEDIQHCFNQLGLNTIYHLKIKHPSNQKSFNLYSITAAFGTLAHLDCIFKLKPSKHIEDLILVAVEHSNHELFNSLFYGNKQYRNFFYPLLMLKEQQEKIHQTFYSKLIIAAAASNNVFLLNTLLVWDKSGSAALGVPGVRIQFTPLYYAAATNSLDTFKRLLKDPKVRKQFPGSYHQFYRCLKPSRITAELKEELDQLRPCSGYISSTNSSEKSMNPYRFYREESPVNCMEHYLEPTLLF